VRSRSSLLILAGALLVSWLLLSSIHFVQPTQASQQSGGGGGGGSTSSITSPLFQLPKFSLPSIKFPGFNFSLPSLSTSLGNATSVGPGNGSGQGDGLGNGSGVGVGGSGNGNGYGDGAGSGNGGNSGGSGPTSSSVSPSTGRSQSSGQSQQTVISQATQNNHVTLSLPYDLLIAIVIMIIIFASAIAFVSRKGWSSSSKKRESRTLSGQETVQFSPPIVEPTISPVLTELAVGEIVSPFRGWGTQGGFIQPEIKPEFPLIWSLEEAMSVQVPDDTVLLLDGSTLEKLSPASYSVRFSQTCNVLVGTVPGATDTKSIRAVHYNEDVIKHFRLNFFRISDEELSNLTPRELGELLHQKYSESISDRAHLFRLIRVFERAFYGKKEISRADYEEFLISLSSSITNPKVIICGKSPSSPSQDR
jgi:hypothetical protein